MALVLPGGGALGAYQVGVYQAMDELGVRPDWVAGVSIAVPTLEREVEKLGRHHQLVPQQGRGPQT